MSFMRGAELMSVVAAQSGESSRVIWGLIALSVVLEIIVLAVCITIVRRRRRKRGELPRRD